ncbi:hypothetical protein GQ457_09G026090 [Hibiscus cannabinus]
MKLRIFGFSDNPKLEILRSFPRFIPNIRFKAHQPVDFEFSSTYTPYFSLLFISLTRFLIQLRKKEERNSDPSVFVISLSISPSPSPHITASFIGACILVLVNWNFNNVRKLVD